jgi:threonine/homoserine/homoserine lactone efflux protein
MALTLITLIKGTIIGIVIALPVGPVGILCVRRTLFEGLSFGLVSGLGAACADTMFGVIAGFGVTFLRDAILGHQDWLGEAGGLFLVYAGTRALVTRPADPEPLAGEALFGTFASAFALTIANPVTLLSFTAIFAKVGLDAGATAPTIAVMVAGIFIGSAAWWLGLTVSITRIRRRARGPILGIINHVSGGILLICGVGLLIAASLGLAGMRL